MTRHMKTVTAALCGMLGITCAVCGAESALDFPNSSSRVKMTMKACRNLTNLTISVWVKPNGKPGSESFASIAGHGYLYGANGFGLYFDSDGNTVFQTRNDDDVVSARVLYSFDGKWHHLAGVREGNDTRIYLDGILKNTAQGSLTNLYTEGFPFALGVRYVWNDWGFSYSGAMAEVRFWDQARTQTQIQDDMFRTLAGTETGLAGYWPLNEGSGGSVRNLTAGGDNGEIIQARWLTDNSVVTQLPLSRDPMSQGYWPFTLADQLTGNTHSTDANVVAITDFPALPAGYNAYQISASPASSVVDPAGWISINTPPEPSEFAAVAEGQPAALFAWFTNTTASVPLRRSGATITYATMGRGKVLDLSSGSARVAMDTGLYPTMTNLTLTAWIKIADKPSDYASIAGRGYLSGGVSGFGLFMHSDGKVYFQTRDHDIANVTPGWDYPFGNAWHHLAGVRDGNVTRLYIDGEEVATKEGAISQFYMDGVAFGIGQRYSSGWGYPFNGMIAEVQLWDYARTPAQIQDSMFQCLAGTEPGLAGYWPLNEGAGAIATDWAAGNNGSRHYTKWSSDRPFGTMMSASGAYLGHWPFTLADLDSGDTRVTDSNVVSLAGLSVPTGYDLCQFSASSSVSNINPEEWISTDALPETLTLSTDAGRDSRYAWFTNTTASVSLRRSTASIIHFPAEAVLDFRASARSRVRMAADQYPRLTDMTLTAWIKPSPMAVYNSYAAIAGQGYLSGAVSGFGLYLNGSSRFVCFQVRNENAEILQVETPYPFDGRWHHLAGVREGNDTRLYLDGVLKDTVTGSLSTPHSLGIPFALGQRYSGGWGFPFDGAIAEVRLWNRARSTAQIQEEMFRCLADTELGVIGYWPLSEGEGSTVTDWTDAGNDGTVSGADWVTDKSVSALLPVSRNPAWPGYWPLTLSDLTTADTLLTDSAEVTVDDFPVPTGYTAYRISASPTDSGAGEWIDVATPPSTLTFADTVSGSRAALYAWFTNTTESTAPRRSGGSMIYASKAAALDLTSSSARADMGAGLYPTLTNLTLTAWVKSSVKPERYGAIAGRGYLSGALNGFGLLVSSDSTVTFQTRNGDIANIRATTAYSFDNEWHHLAGVRDGDVTRLYFDGTFVDESIGAITNFYMSGIAFGVGMRHENGGWGFPFNGAIAEVQLWDYARSGKDIRSDMRYRLTGAEPGLIGYWPLDEAEGRWVEDLTAAGNYGQLSNAGWDFSADFLRTRPPPGTIILIR